MKLALDGKLTDHPGRARCASFFCVIPAERVARGPGPIRRSLSRAHGVWVPAYAGTTIKKTSMRKTTIKKMTMRGDGSVCES